MDTQLNGQMTIKDYADHHRLSVSTIRRRIKAGTLPAEQIDGKWYIQVEQEMNTQIEQGGGKWEGAPAPDTLDNPLVAHLESEVEYLRDQLDKQTQLLAAATKHNADLIQQLPPPRRSHNVSEWVRKQIAKFRKPS